MTGAGPSTIIGFFCDGQVRKTLILSLGRRASPTPVLSSAKWRGTCAVHFVSEQRQSDRHPVLIPVILRGKDGQGRVFFDRASIVSIDGRGARVHTRFHLKPGNLVTVELPGDGKLKPFRVVWGGDPGSFYDGMVGLEFIDPENSWDVETLRTRWAARNL